MSELIAVAVVAFLIGLIVAGFMVARIAGKILQNSIGTQEQMQELAIELLDKVIFLRIEQHLEVIYAYNAANDEFVCQGKNMDDLTVNFGLRYPNKKGIVVKPEEGEANELVQRN
jgi:hypothetical protein